MEELTAVQVDVGCDVEMTQQLTAALVVSTPDAKFAALVYRQPFAESFAKVAALGFKGIEVAIRDPRMADPDELRHLAEKNELKICALGTGQAFGTEGLCFTDPDPSVRGRAVQRIKEHIALAKELGALVIIGLIRGKGLAGEPAELHRGMLDGMRACADEASRLDVDLVIEPINRYETALLNTIPEALAFLDELGSPRVGLLLDTFHMNIEEPSIGASIRQAGRRIGHVHVADSNRWAPGCGHLDFPGIVAELRASGYVGYLSAEILPYPDPDAAARQVAVTMAQCGAF